MTEMIRQRTVTVRELADEMNISEKKARDIFHSVMAINGLTDADLPKRGCLLRQWVDDYFDLTMIKQRHAAEASRPAVTE